MNTLALEDLRRRISKGWRKEKCPCGQKGCHSWNVTPVTYGQGIIAEEADADLIAEAPELLVEVLELRESAFILGRVLSGQVLNEEDAARLRHLKSNQNLRESKSCLTCGHRECASLLDDYKQRLKSCGDWRANTGKALFRYARPSVESSMKTVIDVEFLDDIPISETFLQPFSCKPVGFDEKTRWNTFAVIDADGFTFGYTNKLLTRREP